MSYICLLCFMHYAAQIKAPYALGNSLDISRKQKAYLLRGRNTLEKVIDINKYIYMKIGEQRRYIKIV